MKITATEIKDPTKEDGSIAFLRAHPVRLLIDTGKHGQKLGLTYDEARALHRQLEQILYPIG